MTLLSPSIIRLEQPIGECARVLNNLGCQSVHVDVCQGLAFPGFFSFDEVQTESLCAFNACVTMHLFRLPGKHRTDLSFLRKTDLAVLHMFPNTIAEDILNFLEAVQLTGCRPGLSLDIKVDPSAMEPYLPALDTAFVMGIPVATCGLRPDQSTLNRLVSVSQLITKCNPQCRLGIDGGVNNTTFSQFIALVDELVIGSLLLHTDDIAAQWAALTSTAKGC